MTKWKYLRDVREIAKLLKYGDRKIDKLYSRVIGTLSEIIGYSSVLPVIRYEAGTIHKNFRKILSQYDLR